MSLTRRLFGTALRQGSCFSQYAFPFHTPISQIHYNTSHLLTAVSHQPGFSQSQNMASLARMHREGYKRAKLNRGAKLLGGAPQLRGIVLRVVVKKPKKPNSANRKCVLVKLSNGSEGYAYIPGEGHNLQEHSIVLVEGGRLQDVPGVKLQCVRGAYDLAHVKKKT